MAPVDLQGICDFYAALLQIKNWTIVCRHADAGEILPSSVGQLNWRRKGHHYTGEILIDPAATHDHEITVVHELIHIPLIQSPPRGRAQATAQEVAIDQYARALVNVVRASHKRKRKA